MPSHVRGRYAPSPTGELHIGNLRTALVAWLGARAARGTFTLRVEDLDQPRVIPGAEARILDDLRWLGLDWDEGPDVGGPFGPYRQSERLELFRAALNRLESMGKLYGCTCSRADLRRLSSAPHGPFDEGPVYPGTCQGQSLTLKYPSDNSSGPRSPAFRFRVKSEEVLFTDLIAGLVRQNVAQAVGDFVVRRADHIFAYQFAVVVDDAAMQINQVVRGADLLHSTPRQLQLFAALGASPPEYAHVPLVLNDAGERLAKRDHSSCIRELRNAGLEPAQLIGLLGNSLGLLETSAPSGLGKLIDAFDWKKIHTHPWHWEAYSPRQA